MTAIGVGFAAEVQPRPYTAGLPRGTFLGYVPPTGAQKTIASARAAGVKCSCSCSVSTVLFIYSYPSTMATKSKGATQ